MNWTVVPGSRISRLPFFLRPIALLVRNVGPAVRALARRVSAGGDGYVGDGITTEHNAGFRREPEFRAAYERACRAGGWDYGIEWRVHQAVWAARTGLRVEGDIVELGTGRGFLMSGVLAALEGWPYDGRRLWMFDTFESTKTEADASGERTDVVSPYYAVSKAATAQNFAEWENVHLVQGFLPESLAEADLDRICFLHIDLNAAEPETESLRALFDRISKGGVLLLDDYAYRGRDVQYDAMNDLSRELGFELLSTPTGQGIAVL